MRGKELELTKDLAEFIELQRTRPNGPKCWIVNRADLDEETVYGMTKAFWDNIDQVTSDAPWAKALSVEFAASAASFAPPPQAQSATARTITVRVI